MTQPLQTVRDSYLSLKRRKTLSSITLNHNGKRVWRQIQSSTFTLTSKMQGNSSGPHLSQELMNLGAQSNDLA